MVNDPVFEEARVLLCRLGDSIRDALIRNRADGETEAMALVAAETSADTIYAIDKVSEAVITGWFLDHWPSDWPVEVVMEGLEDGDPLTFPKGTPAMNTRYKCILDPIDGTRGIMYDKRSAWALAGLAPRRGNDTKLSDIVVASMTELPTSKQWRADQFSAVIGGGVIAEAVDVRNGSRVPLPCRPLACNRLPAWLCLLCEVLS